MNKISPQNPLVFQCFINSFKYITNEDPAFGESLVLNLVDEFVDQFTNDNYEKLMAFIKSVPQYNIYLACYNALLEAKSLNNPVEEEQRQQLLDYLLSVVPELGYTQINKWISKQIKEGPLEIDDICQKYSIAKNNLILILENSHKTRTSRCSHCGR